jgi:hypothetical protein
LEFNDIIGQPKEGERYHITIESSKEGRVAEYDVEGFVLLYDDPEAQFLGAIGYGLSQDRIVGGLAFQKAVFLARAVDNATLDEKYGEEDGDE